MTKDFLKMQSPSEFLKRLLLIDLNITNNYEYFPEDWKFKENQKQHIEFRPTCVMYV